MVELLLLLQGQQATERCANHHLVVVFDLATPAKTINNKERFQIPPFVHWNQRTQAHEQIKSGCTEPIWCIGKTFSFCLNIGQCWFSIILEYYLEAIYKIVIMYTDYYTAKTSKCTNDLNICYHIWTFSSIFQYSNALGVMFYIIWINKLTGKI